MQMFNVQKLICFILLLLIYFFLPQFAFYLLCFALLNFYFAFISSLLCFNVNWNVFLTNIRPQGGTLIFSNIRRLGPFFWGQNSEFQYFFGFSEK